MKGQSMIEFLAMISFSALVLAGLHAVMVSKQSETLEYQNQKKAEKIAEHVSFQVELALAYGDGYSRVFSVPETVGGYNYTVEIINGSSHLEWSNSSVIQPSRYRGDPIEITTANSSIYRALNDGGEVKIVEE